MSEGSSCLEASAHINKSGPDYFSYYTCQVKELLSQDDDSLPFSMDVTGNTLGESEGKNVIENGSNGLIFSNSVGAGLSDYKKERLNALLRQAVAALAPAVDQMIDKACDKEMIDSVIKMDRIKSEVRCKRLASENIVAEGGAEQNPSKKLKISSSFSSTSNPANASPASSGSFREGSASKCMDSGCLNVALPREGISNVVLNHCAHCSIAGTPAQKTGPEGKGDDDMQFLLQTDSSMVEKAIKKYSDELITTLAHMEKQLEELLDAVVSTCRPMKTIEKQELQELIKKLPPKNLNRVAEIVQRGKPLGMQSSDEVLVDLEQQDNVTLQRLYYYVEAVEKTRELLL
ncbi:unnamed protein product [Dovyalis caffra]|uniref:NET domain-containing protein n=1 Tax=Dovyalis caffra TaxID=77055 RepID=A0AAV1R6P8_9ROSI|nr:unnamed protein product [Dovyalis caffra]